jgi:hypothetical protein
MNYHPQGLIGRRCRVTFDIINIGLKGETSLFEWVWTDTLRYRRADELRLIEGYHQALTTWKILFFENVFFQKINP